MNEQIDIIKITNIIYKDNPNLKLSSISNANNVIKVIGLIDNEYFEICHIDVKECQVYVNKFLEIYKSLHINKDEIIKLLK